MSGNAPDRRLSLRAALLLGSLAAAFLLMIASSVAPQLHEWMHADSSAATHQCAVTMMSNGQCDDFAGAMPSLVAIGSRLECETIAPSAAVLPARFDFSLLEHAPPRIS